MRLYNTLAQETQEFTSGPDKSVRIYVCGLTPSGEAHLGHARSFLFFDVLRRWLTYSGYKVKFVQNVTDVDDRSIAAGIASGQDWKKIVRGYHESFVSSMEKLNVLSPDIQPFATEYIPEILKMISELIEKEVAYVTEEGVVFSVEKFPKYGELSHRTLDKNQAGWRIDIDNKKNATEDFALWKFAKPGEPAWESPWGAGRPGWHIECSAMSRTILGESIDIHGGGYDLLFPHHENEIAQSESLSDSPMARFWLHSGILSFNGEKMSKSKGNFEPLSAVLAENNPQAIRLLFLQVGYRRPMNYTHEALHAANEGLERIYRAYDALKDARQSNASSNTSEFIQTHQARFNGAMDNDINTAEGVSVLFDFIKNTDVLIEQNQTRNAIAFLETNIALLGIDLHQRQEKKEDVLPYNKIEQAFGIIADDQENLIEIIVGLRLTAKHNKDFGRADEIRKKLASFGIEIKDTRESSTWSRKTT